MSKARVSQTKDTNSNQPTPTTKVSITTSSSLAPRIEPWNHSQFLKRVSTFNSIKWHIKRNDITPLFCARYGWQCIAKNTLQCSNCHTQINYKTNPLWSIDINHKIAQSFSQNLKSAHTPNCVWKNNPSPIAFMTLPNTDIQRQLLVTNIRTWTQTDSHSFYTIPIIDQTIKTQMLSVIAKNSLNPLLSISTRKNNDSYINLMLLSLCGWQFRNNKYIQCKYCNKCIALHCYEYKRVLSLFPHAQTSDNNKQSFMDKINDEMSVDHTANVLREELPINDTKSVVHRLSKLGLKISKDIRRFNGFKLYETDALQCQARFMNETRVESPQLSAFGFGNYKSETSIRWPKQSILTQVNSKANSVKKKRKRSRDEMSESGSQSMDLSMECKDSEIKRKKMRFSAKKKVTATVKPRKNRKRKTMENINENGSESQSSEFMPTKKRRISLNEISETPSETSVKKGRKRKFGAMCQGSDKSVEGRSNRSVKRVRLDTPNIREKLQLNPVGLHNGYCPFRNKYKYLSESEEVFGWVYCAGLMPKDIIYIQQIAEQSKQ